MAMKPKERVPEATSRQIEKHREKDDITVLKIDENLEKSLERMYGPKRAKELARELLKDIFEAEKLEAMYELKNPQRPERNDEVG